MYDFINNYENDIYHLLVRNAYTSARVCVCVCVRRYISKIIIESVISSPDDVVTTVM